MGKGAYRVYSVIPDGGILGTLVAECETFSASLAIATATAEKSRAIVHLNEIVWPRSLRTDSPAKRSKGDQG